MEPASRIQKSGPRPVPAHRAPDTSFRDDTHPLNVGDAVVVFALDGLGRVWLEGHAAIIAPCTQPHIYRVRFHHEKRNRIRFVNPDWQARPDRSLALLIEFFRANRITNPSVADFFPDSPE
jgi:hypothetical protein